VSRRAVLATAAGGTALLGVSVSTRPGSRQFYALTFGVAGTWAAAGLAQREPFADEPTRRPAPREVATAAGIGVGAFYAAALVARRIPVLRRALTSVLHYAHQGSDGLVLLTTLANGVGEEFFFRGAVYDSLSRTRPVPASTALYVASTTATGNPALVLASGVMGTLLAEQRRVTGGLAAPLVTHLTWSTLMLRFLPPLFPPVPTELA